MRRRLLVLFAICIFVLIAVVVVLYNEIRNPNTYQSSQSHWDGSSMIKYLYSHSDSKDPSQQQPLPQHQHSPHLPSKYQHEHKKNQHPYHKQQQIKKHDVVNSSASSNHRSWLSFLVDSIINLPLHLHVLLLLNLGLW